MNSKMYNGLLAISLVGLLQSGCVASLVKVEPTDPQVKTIRMNTGSLLDDGTYRSAFEKAATKVCDQKDYEVLEKTRTPSTLTQAGVEPESSNDFFWVVRCAK